VVPKLFRAITQIKAAIVLITLNKTFLHFRSKISLQWSLIIQSSIVVAVERYPLNNRILPPGGNWPQFGKHWSRICLLYWLKKLLSKSLLPFVYVELHLLACFIYLIRGHMHPWHSAWFYSFSLTWKLNILNACVPSNERWWFFEPFVSILSCFQLFSVFLVSLNLCSSHCRLLWSRWENIPMQFYCSHELGTLFAFFDAFSLLKISIDFAKN